MRKLLISTLVILALAACGGGAATEPPPAGVVQATVPSGDDDLFVDPLPTATLPPPVVAVAGGDEAPAATIAPTELVEIPVGPFDFPADVNPITGLVVADPAVLQRRPLAVKIPNFPRYVRPQTGLSFADNVWEHYAEGGLSRFTAIFWSQIPEIVGPLRSARLIDTVLPEMYNSGLVTSGSSLPTLLRMQTREWWPLVVSDLTYSRCPPLCRESEDTNALYADTAGVYQILDENNAGAPNAIEGLQFYSVPPAGGTPVSQLEIEYSFAAITQWRYDAASGRYMRYNEDGEGLYVQQTDAINNAALAADTVVVLFVNHVVDRTIQEDSATDGAYAHYATEIQLWNNGPAWVFRDGQRFEATWVRLNSGDMLGLVDPFNNPIPLKPGVTWFQTVGLTSDVVDGDLTRVIHKSPQDRFDLPTSTPDPANPDSGDGEGDAAGEGDATATPEG